MFALLLGAVLGPDPILGGREPRPAAPWEHSVRAKCGASTIEISGYGVARPSERRAVVLINGRPVVGPQRAQLLADLAHRRAAYRFEILCSESQDFSVRVRFGEKVPAGDVRFWSSAVFFKRNRIVTYTGLQEGDQKSFWFR